MLFSDMLPQLLVHVPGCPDPVAINALRDAAIDLCTFSRAWSSVLSIALVDGQGAYAVSAPTDARCVAVISVRSAGWRLTPVTDAELDRSLSVGGPPRRFNASVGSQTLNVYPAPSTPGQIVVRAAFAPTRVGASLPDELGEEYFEALLAGARGRLMVIPGRSWSNPALGQFYLGRFENAKDNARIDALHAHADTTIVARAPMFGH